MECKQSILMVGNSGRESNHIRRLLESEGYHVVHDSNEPSQHSEQFKKKLT